jgi:phosphotransferase system HPr (HPr) family protein
MTVVPPANNPSLRWPPTLPSTPASTNLETVRRMFVLNNRRGLHSQPAILLINTLLEYHCTATVECNGAVANARSVFELMCLAAGFGSKLTFTMTGSDAKQAMAAIQNIFDTNFAEAYADRDKDVDLANSD